MNVLFYVSASVAVLSTLMMITRSRTIHALLYLVVSFFAIALVFVALGAAFVAALELIIYAGAIIVLFIFVVMLLNPSPTLVARREEWLNSSVWIGPAILALVLLVELIYAFGIPGAPHAGNDVAPEQVGLALYGPYMLGVELASMLLLAGLVGAHHLNSPQPGSSDGGPYLGAPSWEHQALEQPRQPEEPEQVGASVPSAEQGGKS